jgi:hypothetical protein
MLEGDDQKAAVAGGAAQGVDLRRGMNQPAATDEGPTGLPRDGASGRNPGLGQSGPADRGGDHPRGDLHRAKRLGGRRPRETERKDAQESRHPKDPTGPAVLATGRAGLPSATRQGAGEA